MRPAEPTTLDRMWQSAQAEVDRIELTQQALVASGHLSDADPDAVRARDDFAGMVRLIDKILSNAQLMELLAKCR